MKINALFFFFLLAALALHGQPKEILLSSDEDEMIQDCWPTADGGVLLAFARQPKGGMPVYSRRYVARLEPDGRLAWERPFELGRFVPSFNFISREEQEFLMISTFEIDEKDQSKRQLVLGRINADGELAWDLGYDCNLTGFGASVQLSVAEELSVLAMEELNYCLIDIDLDGGVKKIARLPYEVELEGFSFHRFLGGGQTDSGEVLILGSGIDQNGRQTLLLSLRQNNGEQTWSRSTGIVITGGKPYRHKVGADGRCLFVNPHSFGSEAHYFDKNGASSWSYKAEYGYGIKEFAFWKEGAILLEATVRWDKIALTQLNAAGEVVRRKMYRNPNYFYASAMSLTADGLLLAFTVQQDGNSKDLLIVRADAALNLPKNWKRLY